MPAAEPQSPTVTAEVGVRTVLAAAVAAIGGVERAGQVEMAEAVETAMRDGGHLLVQAGTGTGKSLAYLVPALLHAESVVIATATIALQNQVVDRDLPALVDAVEPLLGRRPTYAILKGRANYLCRNKVAGGMPDDSEGEALFDAAPTTTLGREVVRLRGWAEETETGDRDELAPGVTDRAWRQVSVSARECLGALKCPHGQDCFAELSRERAAGVEIVVTNQAMLAIDALENFQVLPDHDVVVVDEGHELVDRVTGVATGELTTAMVTRAVARGRRLLDEDVIGDLLAAGEALEGAMASQPEGRVVDLPEQLASAVSLVRDAARSAMSGLSSAKDADDGRKVVTQLYQDKAAYIKRVNEAARNLIEEGYLLDEDLQRVMDRADRTWDWVMR